MKYLFGFFALIGFNLIQGQVISIQTARSTALGTQVTVRGIVTCGAEFGNSRYMQDQQAGIALFGTSLSSLGRGDSVEVTGTLAHFNNLLQLTNLSFSVLAKQVALPQPIPFTGNISAAFAKKYESRLVRIDGVNSIRNIASGNCGSAAAVFTGGTTGQNYCINGVVTTPVRILPGTDIPGKNVPSGTYSIVGIISMFNRGAFTGGGTTADPQYYDTLLTTGFQMTPRGFDDFILPPRPNILSDPTPIAIGYDSLQLEFTTQYDGTTKVYYGTSPSLGQSMGDSALVTKHTFTLRNLQPGTVYYVAVTSSNIFGTSVGRIKVFVTRSMSSGEVRVYFNRYADTSASYGRPAMVLDQTCDDTVVAYINRTQESLDLAIYNINPNNLADIIGALNAAKSRGVRVRVVADGSTANVGLNNLDPGIGLIQRPPSGASGGIMHNKFMIIDVNRPADAWVWTGSTNLTTNQVLSDPNNMIFVQDQSLAKAYMLEFEEMFGSSTGFPNGAQAKFGSAKTDNTPHHFIIGGKKVEMYFSPTDRTTQQILNTINGSKKETYALVYTFTRTDIANALRNRAWAGVYGAGAMDDTSSVSTNVWNILSDPGVWGNRFRIHSQSGILHHKYLLVDPSYPSLDPTVLTGSHNWSNVADNENDENTLIIHDHMVANQYYQNFVAEIRNVGFDSLRRFADFISTAPIEKDWTFKADVHVAYDFEGITTLKNATYSWDFGDGQSGTGKMVNHTYHTDGLYTIRLVVKDGNQIDSVTKTVKVGNFTSVINPSKTNKFNVWPIPADRYLTWESEPKGSWRLSDIQGRIIQSGRQDAGSTRIITEDIPAGMYYLIIDENAGFKTAPVLIRH